MQPAHLLPGPPVVTTTTQNALLLLVFAGSVRAEQTNPLGKMNQTPAWLGGEVKADCEPEEQAPTEFSEWRAAVFANTPNHIKAATSQNRSRG